jgi:hypothetical protein
MGGSQSEKKDIYHKYHLSRNFPSFSLNDDDDDDDDDDDTILVYITACDWWKPGRG